jgi:hypothetical protein
MPANLRPESPFKQRFEFGALEVRRLKLGYGLAPRHPRVARARAHRRCPLRGGTGLSTLPKQGKQKRKAKPASKGGGDPDTCRTTRRPTARRWAGCSTRLAALAFVPQPAQRRLPERTHHRCEIRHGREHIRVARHEATMGAHPQNAVNPNGVAPLLATP